MRWFIEQGNQSGYGYHLDLVNSLTLLGAAWFVWLSIEISRSSIPPQIQAIQIKAYRFFPKGFEWRIIAFFTGALLIVNSATGVFLAPNLALPGRELVVTGSIIQLVIGLLFFSRRTFAIAGFLILILAIPLAAFYIPTSLLIDYGFEFIALALAFILIGLDGNHNSRAAGSDRKYCPEGIDRLALPITRMGLGMTLITLAIHGKLIDPDLALTFLDQHDLNFMPLLGFSSFTNLHFAFASGVAELVFGLLLLGGIATRFVTAVLSVFLTIPLFVLGPAELIGHLPLFGVALLLIIRGSGGYYLTIGNGAGRRPLPA
ncbi:MAG: hypothetical protein ACE5Q6_06020 [Dehalococcoidia bacterium]